VGKPIRDQDRGVLTVADIPDWVLRFAPKDWRDEADEPWPGTFEGDEDRWRDLNAWRRWHDAKTRWRNEHARHLRWRVLDFEARRRWPVVDPISHPPGSKVQR
jgi:hypothetical protein